MKEESRKKIAKTTKERHGEDFYSRIAKNSQEAWEKNGKKPRGFAAMRLNDPERLAQLTSKGGKQSKIKRNQ